MTKWRYICEVKYPLSEEAVVIKQFLGNILECLLIHLNQTFCLFFKLYLDYGRRHKLVCDRLELCSVREDSCWHADSKFVVLFLFRNWGINFTKPLYFIHVDVQHVKMEIMVCKTSNFWLVPQDAFKRKIFVACMFL